MRSASVPPYVKWVNAVSITRPLLSVQYGQQVWQWMLLPSKFPLVSHLVGTSRITGFISLSMPWGCLTKIPGVKFSLEVHGLYAGSRSRLSAPKIRDPAALDNFALSLPWALPGTKGFCVLRPLLCFSSFHIFNSRHLFSRGGLRVPPQTFLLPALSGPHLENGHFACHADAPSPPNSPEPGKML